VLHHLDGDAHIGDEARILATGGNLMVPDLHTAPAHDDRLLVVVAHHAKRVCPRLADLPASPELDNGALLEQRPGPTADGGGGRTAAGRAAAPPRAHARTHGQHSARWSPVVVFYLTQTLIFTLAYIQQHR